MAKTREEIIEERRRLKEQYPGLFDQVAELLFRHDPMGINFETNTDEYEPEVGTILRRLRKGYSVNDAQEIVHAEFVRWFGVEDAGSPEQYAKIAAEIWELWEQFNAT